MKRSRPVLLLLILTIFLSGCGTISHRFKDDSFGQVAERFFPDVGVLSESAQTEFEYRTACSIKTYYESYFLRSTFETGSDYERFLDQTERDYKDMTAAQRERSYFIIPNARFTVDDYSFRAIDMSGYGEEDRRCVGLIAHCDTVKTVVFLYMWHEDSTIEEISDGLGQNGYMDYYADLWKVEP